MNPPSVEYYAMVSPAGYVPDDAPSGDPSVGDPTYVSTVYWAYVVVTELAETYVATGCG